ncbi:MAG: GNAT family N-acetyltransferase [Clostridia bacterium]|nr:GNAT family N-acetyltransferase [Clostridia bacterium]
MSILIRKAVASDLDSVEQLYEALLDQLEHGINYPGWRKGSYPLRADAEEGLAEDILYVAEIDGRIAGTVMYPHTQDPSYRTADWQIPYDSPVLTLHILAVHPDCRAMGVGRALVDYADTLARERGVLAVRLDTHENNLPACRLYEKCGYHYCGLVDLGLEEKYGLKWYRTYEKLIR